MSTPRHPITLSFRATHKAGRATGRQRLPRALIFFPLCALYGCSGILSDLSSDGELNEEYRLKNQYKECLKQSAQDGRDCSRIKDDLLQEQQWNFMDGGV